MSDEPLIATKDHLGEYDAIETAKPDEPLFPIQGGDPHGPPTVLHWAELARGEGRQLISDHPEGSKEHTRGLKLLDKATNAEQVAWAMQSYQRGDKEPTGGRASYNDLPPIEIDESEGHDRAVRAARIKAAGLLHNLVGQGVDIADALDSVEACPPEVAALRNAIEQIKAVAYAVEPRRGHERS